MDNSVFHGDVSPKSFEPTNVFHHRPRPDAAPPRQGNLRLTKASQQGPDAEKTGSQTVDQLVRGLRAGEPSGLQPDPIVDAFDLCP